MRLTLKILSVLLVASVYIDAKAQANVTTAHPGLKTVVIDAGHGGKDPGALGKGGKIHEKHIVLDVAKKLGQRIKEHYPDVKVIFTRSSDVFIGLHERAMVARRNNADLFISIHCNGSSSTDAKGTSVHILGQNSDNSRNKTDYFEKNMSVAQRENSVIVLEEDYKTKYQTFDPSSPESYISHQLQWMAYYESSLLFASEVVDNLIATPLTPRKIVIDQDIFQVLVEANMPAVLLELAFVTNPTEYKYLSSEAGQNQIADRLFRAFKSYKAKYDASVAVGLPDEQKPVSATEARAKTQESSAENEKTCYGIQIMGLARQLKCSDPAFKGFDVYSVKGKTSTIYKYIYGKYDTAAEAKTALPAIRKKFPEAFLVEVKGTEVKRVK
jgi:N-acetylmuramoyl-L-alanine amidase